MRHRIKGRKLNRTSSHRKSLLANLAIALIKHEQIKTTLPKAKEIKPYVDKLITIAKKGDLSSYRKVVALLHHEKDIASKLFKTLAPRYEGRSGGYSRIIKSGFRYGDSAPVAIIELVDRDISEKGSNSSLQVDQNKKLALAN